jgi:hypothetical protein
MPDYKITPKQKAYLDSLVCQRISDDEANRQLIEIFSNPKSSYGIIKELKNGWNRDKKDKVAFYLIKDPKENQPVLFFSLKCGEMHMPLVPEKLNKSATNSLMLLNAASSACGHTVLPYSPIFWEQIQLKSMAMDALDRAQDVEVEDWAKEVTEKQLVNGVLPSKAWHKLWRRVFRSLGKQQSYDKEILAEGENIIRTKQTFAAVELVHFCYHKPAKDQWETLGMSRSLGKNMFWHFIEPIIRDIRDLVGCEYIYLFAADKNKNGRLTKYYRELGFDFRDDINVTKPAYDFCCYFMCQDVSSLRTRKNEFFREYNNPVDPHEIQ